MGTSTATLKQQAKVAGPFYVFELPVRIWHWLHALSITTLVITGFLFATPLPSFHGEASSLFTMGYIRMVHFIAAMVFAAPWPFFCCFPGVSACNCRWRWFRLKASEAGPRTNASYRSVAKT